MSFQQRAGGAKFVEHLRFVHGPDVAIAPGRVTTPPPNGPKPRDDGAPTGAAPRQRRQIWGNAMPINATAAAAVFAAAIIAAPAALAAAPDLVPIPSRISHGVVSVKNQGDATAGPSLVTVECNKTGGTGGCANHRRWPGSPVRLT